MSIHVKILFLILLSGMSVNAQKLYIIRGEGLVDGFVLSARTYKPILPTSKVELKKEREPCSEKDGRNVELYAGDTRSFSGKDLIGLAGGTEGDLSRFKSFVETTFKESKRESRTEGSVKGGIEGLDESRADVQRRPNGDMLSPVDSAKVAGNTVTLEWEIVKAVLKPKIVVMNVSSGQKIFESAISGKGSVLVELPEDAQYEWYIFSAIENKKIPGGLLIRLSPDESAKVLSELAAFKSEINGLSPEMQFYF